jgi:hypothetical protein
MAETSSIRTADFRINPTKTPGSGTLPAILLRGSRDGHDYGDRKQGRPPSADFGVGTLDAQSSGLALRSGDRSKRKFQTGWGRNLCLERRKVHPDDDDTVNVASIVEPKLQWLSARY